MYNIDLTIQVLRNKRIIFYSNEVKLPFIPYKGTIFDIFHLVDFKESAYEFVVELFGFNLSDQTMKCYTCPFPYSDDLDQCLEDNGFIN